MLRADFAETLPPSFKWKRFWAPLGTEVPSDARGYIVDPESSFWNRVTTDVVPLEALADTPCIVLLGDPGIGKTRQIKDEVARLHAAGVAVRHINLGVHDRATLRSDVLDADWFRSWGDGTEHLTLFFDALDESLSNIESIAAYFLNRLADLPLDRLRLRIACRSPVWPEWFDRDLEQLIGKGRVTRYELLPLRACDVEDAARQVGLDPARFFEALDRADAHGLAARPLTLQMLLGAARALAGDLPTSRTELFARAVEKLAEESEADRYPRAAWSFDRAHRVAAAARIAAASILCRKHVISRKDHWPQDEYTLYLRDIASGQDPCEHSKADVPQALLKETLRTAMFTAVDIVRVTWSHRSVAEYLAATWLKANDIIGDRSTPLLFHPVETNKVIPQLRGVAAWLASFDRQTFDRLLATDPLVLVTADAGTFDEAARARIVSAFLDKLDKLEAHDWMGDVRRYYANLTHSGLAEQLRPYIVDETKNRIVRRAAIDIAEACFVTALDETLADLALDHAADYHTRVQAIQALRKIGSNDALRRLRELLLEPTDNLDDELLGSVFLALWPRHLSTLELVRTLRPRRAPLTIGAYWMFLSSLPEELPDADVALVLEWATEHIDSLRDEELLPRLAHRARSLLANPAVRNVYAYLLVRALEDQASAVTNTFSDLDIARRKELLPIIIEQVDDLVSLWSLLRGASTSELCWLPSLLEVPLSSTGRQNLIELLRLLFSEREDVGFIEALINAARVHADLETALGFYLHGVDIDSELAQRMRQDEAQRQKWKERRKRSPQSRLPSERIQDALERLESGDLDGFWQISVFLPLEPESAYAYYAGVPRTRIVEEPGWNAADDAVRARIVAGAQRYLEGRDAEPDAWLGKSLVYYPAIAGNRALQLLADVDRTRLDLLSPDVWRRWAPAIAAQQLISSKLDDGFFELLRRAYRVAPVEVLDTILRVIAHENRELRRLSTTDVLEGIWDDRVTCALMSIVRQRGVHPETKRQLLTLLLRHRVPGALRLCERLLRRALRRAPHEHRVGRMPKRKKRAVRAKHQPRLGRRNSLVRKAPQRRRSLDLAVALCQALVDGDPPNGWPIVWRWIRHELTFGRAVLLRIADHTGLKAPSWLHYLTEEQVAELYRWMVRAFPPNEDRKFDTAHIVTPREAVGWFRKSLLRDLRNRKTFAARDALRRLAAETGDKFLLLYAVDAEQEALDETWVAPTEADLLKLSDRRDARIVLSEAHLLEVVVAALHDFDKKLQGEIPLVRFLWDETSARPKDEEGLSDFIASHLRESLVVRGVIANREVQIRPRRGDRAAEETDIHVDAFIPTTKERVSVIIEVKGNWNRDLETSIDAQLGDRYLADNQCQHGVYVVGWFESQRWDQSDWRRGAASRRDREVTRELLEERAAARAKHGQTIKVVILNAGM